MMSRAEINEITGKVVDAAMRIHTVLGPGFRESAYQACLAYEKPYASVIFPGP